MERNEAATRLIENPPAGSVRITVTIEGPGARAPRHQMATLIAEGQLREQAVARILGGIPALEVLRAAFLAELDAPRA